MKDYMATRLPKGVMSHYSLMHVLNRSLPRSCTHSLTHSLTHALTHSLTGQKHERHMATSLPVGLMTLP